MLEALSEQFPEGEKELKAAFRSLEKQTIRNRTLREEIRMDGRSLRTIRSLSAEVRGSSSRPRFGSLPAW